MPYAVQTVKPQKANLYLVILGCRNKTQTWHTDSYFVMFKVAVLTLVKESE